MWWRGMPLESISVGRHMEEQIAAWGVVQELIAVRRVLLERVLLGGLRIKIITVWGAVNDDNAAD
jgi:hypothetical protein